MTTNNRRCVVYLSAEGRGLGRRILAWVRYRFPDEIPEDVLRKLPLYCLERPLNLSDADDLQALCDAIDLLPTKPALVIIDTLSRYSVDVEESNAEMSRFLSTMDTDIRVRYGCTVLLIHHVGHSQKSRPRGPYSLVANTEANYMMKRLDDWTALFAVDRLKDSENPDPLPMHARVVETGKRDEDDLPITSLVLLSREPVANQRRSPTGKNQKAVLEELRRRCDTNQRVEIADNELRKLISGLVGRRRIKEVVSSLRQEGWLIQKDGVWTFTP